MTNPTLQTKIEEIIGRGMSSVEFVQDYVQFRFDGPCLTAITPPVFSTALGVLSRDHAGWRDGLCSAIGIQIASVRVSDKELRIDFANSCAIAISLRSEDHAGPEAINYVAEDGAIVVV
jgi:hypothetical protein